MASKKSSKALAKITIEEQIRQKRKADKWIYLEGSLRGKVISSETHELLGAVKTRRDALCQLAALGAVIKRPDITEIHFEISGLSVSGIVETNRKGEAPRYWFLCKQE